MSDSRIKEKQELIDLVINHYGGVKETAYQWRIQEETVRAYRSAGCVPRKRLRECRRITKHNCLMIIKLGPTT